MKSVLLGLLTACTTLSSPQVLRPDLAGKVVDSTGRPLARTTVMVYHAGVKTGFSTYCPSCYADCGKRVLTDLDGNFRIKSLAPNLWFELLAIQDGYVPTFSEKADPAKTPTVEIHLAPKPPSGDFSGTIRGHVVDESGFPISDAVVEPVGILEGKASIYGMVDGLEPMAVTNKMGDFEISYARPVPKMLLNVEARAMAPKFITMPTGQERHSVTLSEGAAITGRIVANGKPISNAEIGLTPKNRGGFGGELAIIGDPYKEIRIGTNADGTFTATNVPEAKEWYVYAKMQSLSQGAVDPVEVQIKEKGQYVHAPDLVVHRGYRVIGKVVLSDKKPLPPGMRITIESDRVWDAQTTTLAEDGNFKFANLPAGDYHISPAVKGYAPKGTRFHPFETSVSVSNDIKSLTVRVFPRASIEF